jgi:hypothetical protein
LTTNSIKGLSQKDVAMAKFIDSISGQAEEAKDGESGFQDGEIIDFPLP